MLIRYGYDITMTCSQSTPMLSLLTPRRERAADVRSPDVVLTNPEVATSTYLDLFGNVCRRFMAPAGDFQIWGDGTMEDNGLHDPVFWDAQEVPVADLPDDCLVYLMGSRYCETDKLSQIAWDNLKRVIERQLVNPTHQGQIAVGDWTRQIINAATAQAEKLRLAHDG